jgi:hypothetical protein
MLTPAGRTHPATPPEALTHRFNRRATARPIFAADPCLPLAPSPQRLPARTRGPVLANSIFSNYIFTNKTKGLCRTACTE